MGRGCSPSLHQALAGQCPCLGDPFGMGHCVESPWYHLWGEPHSGLLLIPPPPHQYEVSEDSFFQNMLNFYNFSAKVMADQLRKPPNRDQ